MVLNVLKSVLNHSQGDGKLEHLKWTAIVYLDMLLSEHEQIRRKRISETQLSSEQTGFFDACDDGYDRCDQFRQSRESTRKVESLESAAADSSSACQSMSALHLSINDSRPELVKYLLAKGGRVDSEIRSATSFQCTYIFETDNATLSISIFLYNCNEGL